MPKFTFQKARRTLLTFFVLAAVFLTGYTAGTKNLRLNTQNFPKVTISRELPPNRQNVDFSLFWEVWEKLEQNYFDKTKLDKGEMVYGAIKGMVAAIGDPWTTFLDPDEQKRTQEDLRGDLEGVGIQLGFKGTHLVVITPLPDSPAEKAGVKAGDFIVGIKDEASKVDVGTSGMSLPTAVSLIRGKAGTKVTLKILRETSSDPIDIELTRAKIDVPTISVDYVGGGSLAHIKLQKFGAKTKREWEKAISEILARKEIKGLVLDLRGNPGGYLQQAVEVASDFVKTGSTVVIEERGDGKKEESKSEKIGLLTKMPTVILINEGSASASEILAGALRDLRKIQIVGDKSFGKGTIQEPLDLEGGTGLHITVAKWLTPDGTWVNGEGLTPDVKIKDDPATKQDEQLLKAIEILNSSL